MPSKTNTFFEDWTALTEDMEKLVKNADNPFFKSKYVPLKQILPMVKDKCKKHNFILIQHPDLSQGFNFLTTIIEHVSGRLVEGKIQLVCKDPSDPQKLGGSITYMRRYSLTCMFGLEEEDDDGNFSSQPTKEKKFPSNHQAQGVCSLCGKTAVKGKFGTYCPDYREHKAEGKNWEIITEKTDYHKKLEGQLDIPTYEDKLDATEIIK